MAMRHLEGRRRRRAAFTLAPLAVLLLAVAAPAAGKDLLDWVIEAVDPTLAPARPLIECLAGGGDAESCAAEAAKQAHGPLTIGPGDERVRLAVDVFEAARQERWAAVVTRGGQAVATTVVCGVLPVAGAAKAPACSIAGWVISTNVDLLDKTYQALKGPDWWALFRILGDGVCRFMPDDGAIGAAKDVICGALAKVLQAAQQVAEKVASALVAGADALENLVFGDDSHMPYDQYYALYWQPWYHYGTTLAFEGQDVGPLLGKIWHPCVDYFDSHNQYRSTARKTCDVMRDNRFSPEIRTFATALRVAVDGYFETVARPAVRAAVLASYGKASAPDLPGEKLFAQNCAFQMRTRFPFPAADDGRCRLIENWAKTSNPLIAPAAQALAGQCFADVKLQDVQPTLWTRACEGMSSDYRRAFAIESAKLIGAMGRLKQEGCVGPGAAEAKKSGLVLTCDTFAGYSACLAEFQRDGKKYCRAEVPVRRVSVPGGPQPIARPPDREGLPRAVEPVLPAVVELEAEDLVRGGQVRARAGRAVAQPMSGFGRGWSGGAQLLWTGAAEGATLDLLVDVPRAGSWSVDLFLTRAPDYGQLQVAVAGARSVQRFDGYAPRVSEPAALALGTFSLARGRQPVSLTIVGRSRASSGFLVGVDRIRLRPAGAP